MKCFSIYTVAATVTFGLYLYDPGPALTDTIAAFGSHLCGCFAVIGVRLNEYSMRAWSEADRMKTQ